MTIENFYRAKELMEERESLTKLKQAMNETYPQVGSTDGAVLFNSTYLTDETLEIFKEMNKKFCNGRIAEIDKEIEEL